RSRSILPSPQFSYSIHFFSFNSSRDRRAPHSFPTRRSSDLDVHRPLQVPGVGGAVVGEPEERPSFAVPVQEEGGFAVAHQVDVADRKSTRLNSSHVASSYAVCCLKKKTGNGSRCRPILRGEQ